jgi:predicted SnoaL-like aldol condensation-catalyzing enzyme
MNRNAGAVTPGEPVRRLVHFASRAKRDLLVLAAPTTETSPRRPAMRKYLLALALALSCACAQAQVPVTPAKDQASLLKSSDPTLARNKKLVYDFWREVIEARHLELFTKYAHESYIQHNPNAATGFKGFEAYFSKFPKQPIKPTVERPIVAIMAEGDLVMLVFVNERPHPKDATKKYTTTGFDMFRIENGKIAEHWDAAALNP